MNFFRLKSNNEDLGHTLLENVFINHYMPQAPGSYVKVYILGLKYAQNHSETSLSNEIIAKTLDISVEETEEAWKYWEDQHIIRLVPYSQGSADVTIEFLTVKELMLNIKDKKPKIDKYSPDRIIAARQNFRIKDMFEYIKKIYGREPAPNEMFTYLDWVDDYGMPPELVILLIDDCCTRGKKDLPYLKQVAKNWFDAGVNTLEKANELAGQTKISYPLALDPGAEIFGLYALKTSGVTRNVIIDREGKIIYTTRLFNREEFDQMKKIIFNEISKNSQ